MFERRYLPYWAVLFITVASAAVLYLMGRVAICPCGYVLPWYLPLGTDQGNMHLTDWYTPSHLIHGILFYAALWLVARRLQVGWRLAIATLVEAAWEIIENTDAVISRYREVTISLDYIGDSVINSTFDILAMLVGFWLAARLPVWASVAIIVGFEVLTTTLIRDGLALNIIMLLAPSEAIMQWQGGL